MTDSPNAPRWTSLKPSPAVDAALRRAAAGVCGFVRNEAFGGGWEDPSTADEPFGALFYPDKGVGPGEEWLEGWNRDDLARVFAVVDHGEFHKSRGKMNARLGLWMKAIKDPRAALAGLLDLLGIPVPEGLTNE